MNPHVCPVHHVPLVIVPAQPLSRCPNCHYMTHHLRFEHCPECGRRMQIEEPEPMERCPKCDEAARTRQPAAPS